MKVWMRGRLRRLDRLGGAVDVLEGGAGRARRPTAFFSRLGDLDTASKSPLEAIGKPASMTSTPISSSRSATSSFSSQRHGGAGRLLAVAQRGVEDDDAVVGGLVVSGRTLGGYALRAFRLRLGSHREILVVEIAGRSRVAPSAVSGGCSQGPLSAQAKARPALRGG